MNESSEVRLQQLLDVALERSCSDAERQELAHLLEQSSEPRRTVVEQLFVHSLLQWQSEDISEELEALKLTAAESQVSAIGSTIPGRLRASPLWMRAAATILICATGLAGWQAFPSRPGQ